MSEDVDVSVMDENAPPTKKRRIEDEHRVFNSSWEFQYCFIMPKDKPVCLIFASNPSLSRRK